MLSHRIREWAGAYCSLIKQLQTGLLLLTGLAGYMTARCPVFNPWQMIGLTGSLFLTISGSTILNMVFDRDIDSCMKRTCTRPLPAGEIKPEIAGWLGLASSGVGCLWAFSLSVQFGWIVLAGLLLDVLVYTAWLKRRTAWSVVWGGIAGGMPILAGRTLGLGSVDWIGIMLALTILFWIPTHILTFSLRHQADYARAAIPIFPSRYGRRATQQIIALSSILAVACMAVAAYGINLTWGPIRLLAVLSGGLFSLAVFALIRPSNRVQFGLFKYASIYMMSAMLLLVAGVV